MSTHTSDVLIIGAGLAGMSTALSLPSHLQIDMLSKGSVNECASAWAQGGIAAVLDEEDCFADHIQDTLIAGAEHNNVDAVHSVIAQAPSAIAWLQRQGVAFDMQDDGEHLHLTREGGHRHRRIAHVKDRTGQAVHQALLQSCRTRANIHLHEGHAALDLLYEKGTTDPTKSQCLGAWVRTANGPIAPWRANHTVLATGGLGQLFTSNTNPWTATGDGVAMAWRAGCSVQDMEFIQFHPTTLHINGHAAGLITEALRGEGAVLRLPDGERFMQNYDARAELAPRDIVSRAIHAEMQRLNITHVLLDISHRPLDWLEQHFPGVMQLCASHGIDIATAPIPVAPSAHYACGGVRAQIDGTTELAHLFAVGEVACTGFHGANRLASNSLLECVVMGRAAAKTIAAQTQSNTSHDWFNNKAIKPVETAQPLIEQALSRLMQQCVGICRTEHGLESALRQILRWKQQVESTNALPHNQLDTCSLIVQAALQRKQSRGAHSRVDDTPIAQRNDGEMECTPDSVVW